MLYQNEDLQVERFRDEDRTFSVMMHLLRNKKWVQSKAKWLQSANIIG